MGSSNRFVVALDLASEQYVSAPSDPADTRVRALKRKSLTGDRTLVCALCYSESGRRVPVVVRARVAGERRPHFAHPPGYAPPSGEHHPETVWHLNGKATLARWARTQADVVEVRMEAWLPQRERRSDVRVVFVNGREVALEVQGGALTDEEWTSRHDDYRRNGVVDVWLWHPETRPHWIVLSGNDPDSPQQLWSFDLTHRSVTVAVGAPHPRHLTGVHDRYDLAYRVPHLPPCVGDELITHRHGLDDLELTSHGITIPAAVQESIALELRHAHQRAETLRQLERRREQTAATPAPKPTPRTRTDARVGDSAINTGRTSVDRAAVAHLDWIELQSEFMRAGHAPAYQDSPRLRRPTGPYQHVQCGNCGHTLHPNTPPAEIQTCPPPRPPTPQFTPRTPNDRRPARQRRLPDPDQLPLF
ncbi:competence protein CoiA family protein [Nocardia arizonensis]|uniref:competence protein CoiA family protein n=1 Tax=Nocardia arizonensis TaxID=1141647 RepID=UPI0006D105FB|nr:competence protein CoiA family protein [Nocardia arizonensis]